MESYELPLAAAIGLCAVTWALTRWWYRRQMAGSVRRLDKNERRLLSSEHQVEQARRQIERLQSDLVEARRAAMSARVANQRARAGAASSAIASGGPKEPPQHNGQRAASMALATEELAKGDQAFAARPHGFADTMPMQSQTQTQS